MDHAVAPILIKVTPPPDDAHTVKDGRPQRLKTLPRPPLIGAMGKRDGDVGTDVLGEARDATPPLTGEKLAKLEERLMGIAMDCALGSLTEALEPGAPLTEGLDSPAVSDEPDPERMAHREPARKADALGSPRDQQWPSRSAVTPAGFDELLEHHVYARRGGFLDEAPSDTYTPTPFEAQISATLHPEAQPESRLIDAASPSSLCANAMCNTYLRFPHIVVQELTDMILRLHCPTPPTFTTWMLKRGLQPPSQDRHSATYETIDLEADLGDTRCETRMPLEPSACTMWGSLLNGGTAGNSLNISCQLVDSTGKYLDARAIQQQGLVPFAWIVSLPNGVPSSHFSPTTEAPPTELVQLRQDGERPYLFRAKLAFRKAGVYAAAAVGFPKEACDFGSLKSLLSSPVTLLGSGFAAFEIVHSSAFAANCFIAGPGGQPIKTLEVAPDMENSLLLVTADRFNNLCTGGKDSVAAVGLGSLHVLDIVNRHNGEFEIRFVVRSSLGSTPTGLNLFVNKLALDTFSCTILCSDETMKPKSFFDRFDGAQSSLLDPQISLSHTTLPILPTIAPFPPLETAQRVLPPNYVSLLIPTTLEQMSRIEKQLLYAYHEVVAARTPRSERLYALVDSVKSTRVNLEHYSRQNALARADVDRAQSNLRHMDHLISENLLDTLPVDLEFGDLDKLENDQQEERKKLQEKQKEIESRVEKMKSREAEFLEKRTDITQSICTALLTREQSLNNQTTYLAYLLKKIRTKNLMTIKRQLRREQCDASAADAVVALEAEKMRKDLHAKLEETRLLMKPTAERHYGASSPQPVPVASTPKAPQLIQRHVETTPDNPTTPAFWIAEGRYRSQFLDTKRTYGGKKVQPFTDDTLRHTSHACSAVAYVEQLGLHSFTHPPVRSATVIDATPKSSRPSKTVNPEKTPLELNQNPVYNRHPVLNEPPLVLPPMQPPLPSLPPRRVRRPHSELQLLNALEMHTPYSERTGDSFY